MRPPKVLLIIQVVFGIFVTKWRCFYGDVYKRQNDAYQELKQGVSDTLKKIPVYGDRVVRRIKKTKSGIKQLFIPGMWFEEMGLTYLGPVSSTHLVWR